MTTTRANAGHRRAPRRSPTRATTWEPRLLVFLCHWCSYAAADRAGVAQSQLPPGARCVRLPCSGRLDVELILQALAKGADGVLILGCHLGDCHHRAGNVQATVRMQLLARLLTCFGIDAARVRLEYVAASEAERFVQLVHAQYEQLGRLGPPIRRARG